MAMPGCNCQRTTAALLSDMDNFSKFMAELETGRNRLVRPMHSGEPVIPAIWEVTDGLTDYEFAIAKMEEIAGSIRMAGTPERVWLVEHQPLYSGGTSAKSSDLLQADRFPVFKSGRGGQYTYHGPGQRVVYVMLDLDRRKPDIRSFVAALEEWIIATLADFNIRGERREDRVGVWVERPEKPRLANGAVAEDKIAAIGIRIRRWVSFHGIAINVDPDLEHYSGIVPCGVSGYGVTSLADLGQPIAMTELDIALKRNFETIFGPLR